MYGVSPIKPLLQSLEGNRENFQITLEKFIRKMEDLFERNKEIQKEIHRIFKNTSKDYMIEIKEINYSSLIRISNEKITYTKDFDRNKESIIPIKLTRNAIISILKREESLGTLYMKGTIEIEGGLSEVMKIRNLLDYFFQLI